MDLLHAALAQQEKIIEDRRQLHQCPEVGLHLPQTVAYLQQELEAMGLSYTLLLNGNAIIVDLVGNKPGKAVALRADMDGLPIREETNLDFSSINEAMHACGHDGHMAMLLGALRILKNETFQGTIRFIFQPGEEYPGGAKPMISEGCLKNPDIQGIFGLHAGWLNRQVPKGCLGFKSGPIMASMDRLHILVKGQGVHGASPEQGVDAVLLACRIVDGLQSIVSREISPSEEGLLSITRIHGGTNQNILPDEVELEGTVRATSPKTRDFIAQRIHDIATGIATAHRGEAIITYDRKYPAVINDESMTKLAMKSAAKFLPKEQILELSKPIMGGEDMSYYLEEIPGTFFFLSNPGLIHGKAYPHHNSKFDLDEHLLPLGSALLAQMALDFLAD